MSELAHAHSPLGRAAEIYAKRFQLPVFPCRERGKEPLAARGCLDATRDVERIREWWRAYPQANIGIAPPKGLLILDVDGDVGRETLRTLESEHGALPKTPLWLTGGGGEAHVFRCSKEGVKNRVQFAPKLDVRTFGGYQIAPPSIHPSGRQYSWEVSSHISEVQIADAPDWLIRLISSPNSCPEGKSPSFWTALARDGATTGSRNQRTAELAGHLLRRYVEPRLALELIRNWNELRNNPPLPDHEVVRTVDSIAAKEFRRRMGRGD